MRFFLFVILLAEIWVSTSLKAQALKPEGYFQSDSIKVGEPITYTLTFRYPRELEVVFPDENGQYMPFEYLDRQFFPTHTDSLYSFDSVVYQLTTFELDTLQTLALPVYVISSGDKGQPDSTTIFANADSVFLQRLITQMPDSLDLKANTQYRLVNFQFNYPYLLVAIGAIFLLAVLVYVLFGKKMLQRWRIYRLRKDNKKFNEQFSNAMVALKNSPNRRHLEDVLIVWKKYMERLNDTPYTKLTTKEIVQLPSEERLQENLSAIDRSIYGRSPNGELISHFDHLYEHTDKRFKQRIDEIKHAK